MSKITNKERRLKLFRYGSKAIAKYLNGDTSHYYCPICGDGYPESSAVMGSDLTLEHVPPKSIGGKPILLTCRKCNSSAGHTIDVTMASKKKLEDFAKIISGREKGKIPYGRISFEDISVAATICSETSFDIMPISKANSPSTIERYREHLEGFASNNSSGFKFELSLSQKYDDRYFKLGHLKSAFLLIFAWLGYRYAFDPRLNTVRQQIQEPKKDILGTRFWVAGNDSVPSNKVMFLRNPLPVFLISFDGFLVILPSLESAGDVYDTLPNFWEKGQRLNLDAKVFLNSWPNDLQMKLDYI